MSPEKHNCSGKSIIGWTAFYSGHKSVQEKGAQHLQQSRLPGAISIVIPQEINIGGRTTDDTDLSVSLDWTFCNEDGLLFPSQRLPHSHQLLPANSGRQQEDWSPLPQVDSHAQDIFEQTRPELSPVAIQALTRNCDTSSMN